MKSRFIVLFSYIFVFLSYSFCHGESRAEVVISELSFNLIKQNLRPFSNVSFEFTTESEDLKTKKWELTGRHRIIVDYTNGFYRLSSVKRNKGKRCFFIEKGWDGKYVTIVEKNVTFTPELRFEGVRDDMNVSASVNSIDRRQTSLYLCPSLVLYDGRRFDESLYSFLSTHSMRDLIFSEKSKDEITLSFGRGIECVFNKKNGAIVERRRGSRTADGKLFNGVSYRVEKTENKDGWFFPMQVIYTQRNNNGKIDLCHRLTVVPNTLAMNVDLPQNACTPKIPLGASLYNSIEKTKHTVTELDPFLDREGFIKQADAFIDELKKDLRK